MFYAENLGEFCNMIDGCMLSIFGFCLVAKGKQWHVSVFIASTFFGLSLVPHKEMRFISSIFLPLAICWGEAFLAMKQFCKSHITNGAEKIAYHILRIYIIVEVVTAIEKHSFVRHGDADLYASMASNSESLLVYEDFEFAQVESLYMFNTIDSPGSAWLHVQGPKITMITQCVDYPPFTL